jgi:hypothetical protein
MPSTRVLTRETQYEQDFSVLKIPKEIEEKVQERGFYLYKWISPLEVKASIERDYLSILSKF